jgi:hypothetical protein
MHPFVFIVHRFFVSLLLVPLTEIAGMAHASDHKPESAPAATAVVARNSRRGWVMASSGG